ncbi:9265_t:CDS:1 [Gigaspora margarita]|uniref:9265_t:CDS:1 n=1 Tax=Gigaspora margarita TaxID=4874 RepID=A0ABN7VQ21_GIGMA|nr:9265_t:CDS:1 [Gigaspora margarita]
MQQQIQRFLEEFFKNPKGSNKEIFESNKPSVPNGNETTTPKRKDALQEKDKTESLDYHEDNTKPVISIKVQEMQGPITELTNEQTKPLNSSYSEIHTALSKPILLGRSKLQLILWDLPKETNTKVIQKNLSFHRRALVKRFLENGKSNAALIEIETKNLRRKKELIAVWAIHFEKGKIIRVTQREFDKKTLIECSKNKMIVKNVPKTAAEATLL